MLGILWRYFFKYYLKITCYFILGITVVIFVIDLNEVQVNMSELPGYSTYRGAMLSVTRLPLIIQQSIPFISLIVSMIVFFNLNRTNELVITRAVGVSIWQLLSPFATGSFLLGMFTILVINPMAVSGEKMGLSMVNNWRTDHDQKRLELIPWIHIKNKKEDFFIGAKTILPENNILEDFTFITVNKENDTIFRQDAHFAIVQKNNIYLKEVVEYKYGALPVFKNSTILNIAIKMTDFQKFTEQFTSHSFYEIIKKVILPHQSSVFRNYFSETQFYFMISIPFMLVAMTLIAAAVSLEFNRSNQPRIIVTYGVFAGFMLYTIITLMKSFGKSGILLPFAAALIPIISIICMSIFIILKKEDG
ncbi:MAG: LptF/LptG family permease [Candidatus Liberibacter solanacearum]